MPVTTRFDAFTSAELATLAHALRMLTKYEDEREKAEPLAGEAWAAFLVRFPDEALASKRADR